MLDDAQALAVGEAHVGEAEIERILVEIADRLADRFGARRVEPHPRQRELEQLEEIGLVVDDEHFGLTSDSARHVFPLYAGVTARFIVIRKWAPGPLGSNSSAAPLASASSRAI